MLGGMMIEMIQNADLSILHAIQGAASPALDTFMVGFTTLGEFGALWAIIGCEGELLTAAETAGVRIYPTSGYWMPRHQTDPCGRCVLVGFSSIEPELIPEGVHRLAQAWFPEK